MAIKKSSKKKLFPLLGAAGLLAAILLFGFFLRFYGVDHGLPFKYHCDEQGMIARAMQMHRTGNLELDFFPQPAFNTYLLFAVLSVIGLAVGEIPQFWVYIIARTITALIGTATIYLAYLIGKKAYNEKTGLLAAAFLAFTVLHLRNSHFYWTDVTMTFWVTACVYFSLKILEDGRARDYLLAGLCAGLAAASKYGGALVLLVVGVAHFLRPFYTVKYKKKKKLAYAKAVLSKVFLNPFAYAAVLLAAVAFVAINPYIFINFDKFQGSFDYEYKHVTGVIKPEWTIYFLGTEPFFYHLESVLFWAMGPLLEAVCVLGVFYALWRHRKQDLLLLSWVIPYFLNVGGWYVKFSRYMIPLLPLLCVFGAMALVSLLENAKRHRDKYLVLASKAIIAVVLLSSVFYSFAYAGIYSQPDSRTQATMWIVENAESGATVMLEPSPWERPQINYFQAVEPVKDLYRRDLKVFELDLYKLRNPHVSEESRKRMLEEAVESADYIVISERYYTTTMADPGASDTSKYYYTALFSGDLGFEMAQDIKVNPSLFGIEINDDDAELNFRIFDHPHVWVFKKRE